MEHGCALSRSRFGGCQQVEPSSVRKIELRVLQSDGIKVAKVDSQSNIRVFAGMEAWSRMWLSSLTGTRTYWNALHDVSYAVARGTLVGRPLVTTDAM